jgi:hypothetical protein
MLGVDLRRRHYAIDWNLILAQFGQVTSRTDLR